MEIIKITKERMEQILPSNIKETDVLSDNAKKVLATIMNYFLVLDKPKELGYVFLTNVMLRTSAGIKQNNMMNALQELIDSDLIYRKAGKKRTEGEQSVASRYIVRWNNLTKPLKKNAKTFEELFKDFIKPSETTVDTEGTVVLDIVSDIDIESGKEIETDLASALVTGEDVKKEINKSIKNSTVLSNDSLAYNNPKSDKNLSYKPLNEKTKNATVLSYKTIEEEIREEDFRYNKYKQMLEGITRATAKQVAIENNINL